MIMTNPVKNIIEPYILDFLTKKRTAFLTPIKETIPIKNDIYTLKNKITLPIARRDRSKNATTPMK